MTVKTAIEPFPVQSGSILRGLIEEEFRVGSQNRGGELAHGSKRIRRGNLERPEL
jgi:hypothetical protein